MIPSARPRQSRPQDRLDQSVSLFGPFYLLFPLLFVVIYCPSTTLSSSSFIDILHTDLFRRLISSFPFLLQTRILLNPKPIFPSFHGAHATASDPLIRPRLDRPQPTAPSAGHYSPITHTREERDSSSFLRGVGRQRFYRSNLPAEPYPSVVVGSARKASSAPI